jgi:NDP-sugar pyrophosphorylase family protein
MTDISTCSIIQGGIIAAGHGTRLRADGYRVSKPMVPVGGRPLIDLTLDRFRAVGIRRLTIIINDTSEDCRQWLGDHAGDFDLELMVRTTPSSYASFQVVANRLAGAPAVITTIDSVMPVNDFSTFVKSAADLARNAVALGLTDHVDDETPLWATLNAADSRILQLGGSHGTHVTAGLYWLPAQRPAEPTTSFARLRDYLSWLVAEHQPVCGIVLPCVFDIDRARDIAAAEAADFGLGRWIEGAYERG